MKCWIFVLFALVGGSAYSQQPAVKVACHTDPDPGSPAEIAIYKNDIKGAETLFRAQISAGGTDADRDGLVRVLVLEGKVAEAKDVATKFLAAKPDSSAAETAMGRVAYREGDIAGAFQHTSKAIVLDPCNARAHSRLARIYSLSMMDRSTQAQYMIANDLKPTDDEIHFAWINFLPQKDRLAALKDYMEHDPYYEKDDLNLLSEVDRLKRSAAGDTEDCYLPVTANEIKIPLWPLYSDPDPTHAGYIGSMDVKTTGPQDVTHPIMAWGYDVMIGGKRRRLAITTAVTGIVLNQSAATGFHLVEETKTQFLGPGFNTHLDNVKIGDIELNHCPAMVMEDKGLPKDFDGLIALSFFGKDNMVSFDVGAREIRLSALPPLPADQVGVEARDRYIPAGMEGWSRMYHTWSFWLVPTQINGGPEKLFLLNSSHWSTFVNFEEAKSITKGKQKPGPRYLDGKVNLTFAHMRVTPGDVIVDDFKSTSDSYGLDISGILGLSSFSGMVMNLDYRDGLIQFVPEGKH